MTFLESYQEYNSANEVPDLFTLWGGIFLLNSTAQRRLYITLSKTEDSYDIITPNLYLGFIGSPASGKSFAMGIARRFFENANPDAPLGASTQSKEAIATNLSKDDTKLSFSDTNGELVTTHSMTFFVNELKNWLSINPIGMIDFLTDIYDRCFYDASTIKHGLQAIELPCLNVIACETPTWIQEKFKFKILSGGFARRFICVYHPHDRIRKADQTLHPVHLAAESRCIEHLNLVRSLVGRVRWSDDAWEFYSHWYETTKFESNNEILQQFYSSKNIQAIKVAIGMALNESPPTLILTRDHLERAIEAINLLEPSMLKLFSGIGRNELVGPIQRMLQIIANNKGRVTDKQLLTELTNDLTYPEYMSLKMQLRHSEQIVEQRFRLDNDTIERTWIMSPEYYSRIKTQLVS